MLEQLSMLFYIIPFVFLAFVIAALRGDHDESGNRSRALYLGAVSLVAIIAAAGAVFVISQSLIKATHLNDFRTACDNVPVLGYMELKGGVCNDSAANGIWQSIVRSSLILLVAGYLFIWHRNKISELKGEGGYGGSAAERSIRSFAFLTAFLSVVVIIIGKVGAAYAIFKILAPGVFGAADRGAGVREFIQLAVVALIGWGVMWLYKDETGVFIKWPFWKSKKAETA